MSKDQGIVLVTGATGRQGGAVARELLARGFHVRAMTRKPEGDPARTLAELGAEVVPGDFDEPKSLRRALDGVWGAFSVQDSWEAGVEREEEQGKAFARLAREVGVRHFVYTSVGSAHRETGIPHFESKCRIEEAIRGLSFRSYTILRPVFFMENFLSPGSLPAILDGRLVFATAPETVLQMIAVADIGKYAARAFERNEQMNRHEIELAGDQRTMPETAGVLSEALGREVEFVRQPIEEVRKLSEDLATMVEWFDRVGYAADIGALERKYGIKSTKLDEWARSVRWD